MRGGKPDFRIEMKGETATIWLYDVIGADYFGGITARMFADEIVNAKGASQIELRINSPGGDVFEGAAMLSLLKSQPAPINVYIDGLAASMASVLATVGDTTQISANGMIMIHDPSGGVFGTAEDMRKTADLMDKVKNTLVQNYVERTGMTAEEIMPLMASETWFTAQEALDANFVDCIGSEQCIAACVRPDLFKYRHMPKNLLDKPEPKAVVSPDEVQGQIQTRLSQWRTEDDATN